MRQLAFLGSAVLLLAGGARALADAKNPTYDDDVLPIVKQSCVNCHGNDKQKGDLNLATYAAMSQGGSSGAVVVPGKPDKSRIYTLSAHLDEPKMPPNGNKIADAQLATLKLWVEQGGRQNSGSKVSVAPTTTDIGLKSIVKGRPDGPPPMPAVGKLKLDPAVTARRPGAVLALAASPWAPLLAVGGQKQVILYNTDTHRLVGFIPFEHGQINSIKFSRNGKFLLVAGGKGGQSGKAVLHKVETGEKVLEVGVESDAILAADISADQSQIAVGSPAKLVRIYSTADGKVLHEIKKHTDWVTAVEYSPDGVLLATGDRNGGGFVWEAFTGREYFSLRGHTAMITDVAWRDDSNVLATCSEDTTIRLWEMENGGNIKNWGAHGGGAASVRFTHDGKIASTGRDKATKLWDQNGAAQKAFEAFPDLGLKVAVTHDNARVIGGDWSGVVRAWGAADGKAVATYDANPPSAAERLKRAEAGLAAAEAKVAAAQAAYDAAALRAKTATEAYAAAVATAARIDADLAAAAKGVADATAAATAAKPQMDSAKAELDKAAGAATVAANKARALEAVLSAETTAAKAIADAAAKAPTNADLAAAAKKAADAVAVLNAELPGFKKAMAETAAALVAADAQFAVRAKAYADALALVTANRQKVAALTPMVKPAADAVAPAKAAMDGANAAVAPPKAALGAAGAELTAAKAEVESVRSPGTK
jgi:WD40 repeat protein